MVYGLRYEVKTVKTCSPQRHRGRKENHFIRIPETGILLKLSTCFAGVFPEFHNYSKIDKLSIGVSAFLEGLILIIFPRLRGK